MIYSESLQKQFGSWSPFFEKFITSDKFDAIFKVLKSTSQSGKKVIPLASDLFKSFSLCDKNKVKAIIFFNDPYCEVRDGVVVADGVPLSSSNSEVMLLPQTIFFEAIEDTYMGFDPMMDYRKNLEYLLTEEHILLVHIALSCEAGKPGFHEALWQEFQQFFIKEVLNVYFKGLPIVLCGQMAWKLEKYINKDIHYVKRIEFPGSAAGRSFWNHDKVFLWIDSIIEKANGLYGQITWYRKKDNSKKENKKYPAYIKDASTDLPWDK